MIIAVDFDGVVCQDRFPAIGEPNWEVIAVLVDLQLQGHQLILWTCRRDERLQEAVLWCQSRGLRFDAVNTNLPSNIEEYGGDTRKVFADLYFDDKNVNFTDLKRMRGRPSWEKC